jgi:ornithine carbamoyltransferase
MAMIFEKASTRTRELRGRHVPARRLRGAPDHGRQPAGPREPIEDSARHQPHDRPGHDPHLRSDKIERFAEYSRVPVINGLTNEFHPCQILADIFTFIEHRGSIKGKVVAWVGDGNNMANTWLQAADLLGFTVHVSTPGGYEVDEQLAFNGKPVNPGCYKVFKDLEACKGADLVTTDVWTSMGYEAENEARKKALPTGAWMPR